MGSLPNEITCAQFQVEIFRGYDITGVEFPNFLLFFCIGHTTVQRYCVICVRTLPTQHDSHRRCE